MKAYKKNRMKMDNTPYMPADGVVYIMNSMEADKKIKAEVLKTRTKSHRQIIESIACPECGNPMTWDSLWEGFACKKHKKKMIFEIIQKN